MSLLEILPIDLARGQIREENRDYVPIYEDFTPIAWRLRELSRCDLRTEQDNVNFEAKMMFSRASIVWWLHARYRRCYWSGYNPKDPGSHKGADKVATATASNCYSHSLLKLAWIDPLKSPCTSWKSSQWSMLPPVSQTTNSITDDSHPASTNCIASLATQECLTGILLQTGANMV